MAYTPMTDTLNVHQSRATNPTETASQLKVLFDTDVNTLKTRFNGLVTELNASPDNNENLLINGNFAVNQRAVTGTVVLASGIYGHDRFRGGSAGCTYTFSTALNITTLTISAGTLEQEIEGINLQSGTHVLSWTGTAQGQIDSGGYGATGVTETLVGGTNSIVEFGTGTLSLTKLEKGSVATDFIPKTYAEELRDCKRYYTKLSREGTKQPVASGFAASNVIIRALHQMTEDMRTSPTVSINDLGSGTITANGAGSAIDISAMTFTGVVDSGMLAINVEAAGASFTANEMYSLVLDEYSIELDAEI